MSISRANVAAQIMEHLCSCPLHGYSQPGRHGTSGHCDVGTDAGTIKVTKGDRDCSSAVCEAWELALAGSPYDGLITRYNWTGGMREMFVGSGLFSWEPMSFNASRGDIYLDEENHTAMCIRNDGTADLLGEFSISETGGIDGEPGDQTGRESWVHDYYSGSWDGILHYNGMADVGDAPGGSGSGAPSGDVSELAERVIAGEFGNGDARRAAPGVVLFDRAAARERDAVMRRRLEFLADQVGWLLGDVACLAMVALFMPLVPVFKAFERGKRAGKGK